MTNDFYNPVGVLPIPILLFQFNMQFGSMVFFIILALMLGFLLNLYTKKTWQQSSFLNVVLPVIGSVLLLLKCNISMISIKGLILLLILLYASNSDIKTREVSNFIPLTIFITGLIHTDMNTLPAMFLGAVIISLPQLIVSVINPGTYGGADLKIMAASSFLLGFDKGLISLIVGLVVAIITTYIIRKVRKESLDKSFPMVPYLSIGVMFAYLV